MARHGAMRADGRRAGAAGARILVWVLLLAVAGCALFGEDKPPPPCPRVSVLKDAKNLTKFAEGPGRDLIDVEFEAEIANITTTCDRDIDEDTGEGTLDIEMAVEIAVARGPADRDRKAELRYFVGITDAARNVLNKQVFDGTVAFPGNRSRLDWTDEPVYLTIPVRAGRTGRDFEIFVGFALSRAEVEYNRRRRALDRR